MPLPSTAKVLGLSRRGQLQALQHRSEELIEEACRRIAAHLKLLAPIGKRDGRLFANWSGLRLNLEVGLALLITQREMIVSELAYIDRERLRNEDALPANHLDVA
jgi:hypothetical protein